MATERKTIIALLSDLGTRDAKIASFKSAVMAVTRNVDFVDVTHELRPRDLLEGAFTLRRIYRDFPIRTIFVTMVEQFLGAPRRPLLAVSLDYYYFAPDNGVLSFVFADDPPSNVYHVTAEHYIKLPPGPLAGYRDTYGQAVGWLAKGIDSSNFGEPVEDHVRLTVPTAQRAAPNTIQGQILHQDRFGTLVSNIHETDINAVRQELGADKRFQAVVGDKGVPVVGGWNEQGPEVVALYGPSKYVELVAPKGDAGNVLGAKRGDAIRVVFES